MASFRYTHAVVCRIPLSFRTRAEIELEEARRQHEAFVRLLRELGLDVIELPPDESLPECVFVEDTAVVCNGIALITKPGAATRAKEVETIRAVLKKELGLPIVEISDESARLDGGDVLFTGREFFVGLTEWTNEAGARALAAVFPEYSVTPIKVSPTVVSSPCRDPGFHQHHTGVDDDAAGTHTSTTTTSQGGHCRGPGFQVTEPRHLKAMVTMAGPDVLCVGSGKSAQEVLKRIEREASFSYKTLTVPEDEAANVLYINGTLIHRSIGEVPESCKVFEKKIDFARRTLSFSELAKVGSGLSSCCLLVRRTRHSRHL